MGEYEDFVQKIADEGMEELAEEAKKFSNQEMRKRVGNVAVIERERDELKERVSHLEAAPKRTAALRAAGVDVDALADDPAKIEAIERSRPGEGKEYDEDWAKGLVEKYKLPVSSSGETTGGTKTGAETITDHVTSGGERTAGKVAITPQEANSWDQGKRLRFIEWCDKNKKMDVYNALLRGETVTGLAWNG